MNWAVYGSYAGFHVYTNPGDAALTPANFDPYAFIPAMLGRSRGEGVTGQLRMGMLINGVDMNAGPSGTISATHGEEEMAITVDAFRATIRGLKREGLVH